MAKPSKWQESYHWYALVNGPDLRQGDILNECDVVIPPSGFKSPRADEFPHPVGMRIDRYRLVIMSQSCDLANKHLQWVLACPVASVGEFLAENPTMATQRERIRTGKLPAYHMINACKISGFKDGVQIIDFRNVFGLHVDYLEEVAKRQGDRLRIRSPFKEHLSQAFARFFMRVGLADADEIPRYT